MLKTLTIHLTKTKYRPQVDVLDGWAQDALRLKNLVRFLQRSWRAEDISTLPQKLRAPTEDAKKRITLAMDERGREKEAALGFLTPAFLKWLFASGCLSWQDKGHFAALPSRIAQGIIDRTANENKSFLAALSSMSKDASGFRGRPEEPGFAKDSDLPTLELQMGDLPVKREIIAARERLTFSVRAKTSRTCVDLTTTVPDIYRGCSLIAVRFVPHRSVDTGRRTPFGKSVRRAACWKAQLVFDVPSLSDEEKERVENEAQSVFTAREKEKQETSGGKIKYPSLTQKGDRVRLAKTISKGIREAETAKALDRKSELLADCGRKAKAGTLRVAGGDPGERNLLTLAFPHGDEAISVSGGRLTALNGWMSRLADRLVSVSTKGTTPTKDISRPDIPRLHELLATRERKIEGWFSALAARIADLLEERRIDVLCLGRAGRGWKEDIKKKARTDENRRRYNRAFQSIPYERLLRKLEDRCIERGILVVRTDEAYTSATSFLDNEILHDLSCAKSVDILQAAGELKGRRAGSRFFLADGRQIHADVNGALNIARRGVKNLFGIDLDTGIESCLAPSEFHRFFRPRRLDVLGRPKRLTARAGSLSAVSGKTKPCETTSPTRNACGSPPSSGRRSMANFGQECAT